MCDKSQQCDKRLLIRCDELGCNDYASWVVTYILDGEPVGSHTCDRHVADACNPDGVNTVTTL